MKDSILIDIAKKNKASKIFVLPLIIIAKYCKTITIKECAFILFMIIVRVHNILMVVNISSGCFDGCFVDGSCSMNDT